MKKKIFTVLGLLMFLNLNFLFAQNTIDSALILKYSFTNGSLNNEADTTHNLTNYGATPTIDRYGIEKKALNFDGDDYLSAGSVSVSGNFTYCAWVKVNQFQNNGPYISSVMGIEDNNNFLLLRIGDITTENNRPQFLMPNLQRLNSNTLLNTNQYYFIVFTYNGKKARFYIDGQLDAEYDLVLNVDINENFYLSRSCGNRYMNGTIDDIRVYNRALEIDEIQKLYSYKPYEDGLVVHFPFDSHVNDISSNHLTGITEGVFDNYDRFNRPNRAYRFYYGSYVKANYTNDLFPKDSSDRTISIWINSHQSQALFGGSGTGSYLTHWGDNQTNNASFVQLFSNNIRFSAWGNNADYNYSQPLNQWINITCTYGNDTAKIYLNGQLVKTERKENWNTISSNFFMIGGNIINSTLDDIRVYNKVMSANEVSLLYNQNQINIAIPEGDNNVCSGTTSFYNVTKNNPITKWYLVPTDAGVLTDFDSIVKIEWTNDFQGNVKLFASQLDSNYTYLHSNPLEITVNEDPAGVSNSTPDKPQGNTSVCNANESTIVKTNSVLGANNYEWNIYPYAAGTILGNDTIATINWDPTFKGNAFVSVVAAYNCVKSKESEYFKILVNNIQNNYSMKFDNNSVVEIPKSNNINLSNTTILIDVKADSINDGYIFRKGGKIYNRTFYIYSSYTNQNPTSQFLEYSYNYDCDLYYSNYYYNEDSLKYNSNEWHQLAVTINSNTDSAIFYIDGQNIYSSKTLNDLIYCNDSTSLFYIGNWFGGDDDGFTGLLDNVTLYNRVLSQKEIMERNQKLINPDTEDSLIFYYTFEEGAGNKVIDMSGNGYHGVSYGNPEYVNDVYANNEYVTNNITGETTVVSNSNYIYTTTTLNDATSYAWHLIPSDAGIISGADTSIIIDWTNDFSGIAKLVVNAVYTCEGNPSDTLVINVTNNTNIFISEEKANFKIIPNPSKGNISIQTPETIELLEVYSITGTKVFSLNELSNMQTIQLPIEKGMYIVKLKTQSGVKAQKLIIE